MKDTKSNKKSELMANLGHEIRTPMNAVIGFTDLALDEEGVPAKVRDYLCKVKHSAEDLLVIANEILDEAGVEPGLPKHEFTCPVCSPIDSIAKRPMFRGSALFCDDSDTNQLIGVTNLKKLGFNVVSAMNGKAAVDAAAIAHKSDDFEFDVILMDINMPVMDGISAAHALIKAGVTAPIIAMSANSAKIARDECIAAGMADYITKPFRPQELWDCLLKHLPHLQVADDDGAEAAQSNAQACNTEDSAALNKARGLEYIDGNKELYVKLLNKFVKEQPIFFANLGEAIAKADYSLASQIAHRMKGVSATLGALTMSEFLHKIEIEFKQGEQGKFCYSMLAGAISEFDKVMNEIEAYTAESGGVKKNVPSNKAKVLDKTAAKRIVADAKRSLEKYVVLNNEQIAVFEDTLAPFGKLCDDFVAHCQDYDIESALTALYEIEKLVNIC